MLPLPFLVVEISFHSIFLMLFRSWYFDTIFNAGELSSSFIMIMIIFIISSSSNSSSGGCSSCSSSIKENIENTLTKDDPRVGKYRE